MVIFPFASLTEGEVFEKLERYVREGGTLLPGFGYGILVQKRQGAQSGGETAEGNLET